MGDLRVHREAQLVIALSGKHRSQTEQDGIEGGECHDRS
jgi:hypothetical protein